MLVITVTFVDWCIFDQQTESRTDRSVNDSCSESIKLSGKPEQDVVLLHVPFSMSYWCHSRFSLIFGLITTKQINK